MAGVTSCKADSSENERVRGLRTAIFFSWEEEPGPDGFTAQPLLTLNPTRSPA